MFKFEEFKLQMLNEFIKEYGDTLLSKDNLIIQTGTLEATISLQDAYEEYKLARDFKFISGVFKKTLEEEFVKRKFKIDYEKVYPLIKSKDFGIEEPIKFIRDDLFLNLDILYATDMGETMRFILTDDIFDYKRLKESAYKNLESTLSPLTKLDKDLEIYSLAFLNDYSPSFILLESMKKQIERKVGMDYLLAIPSSTSFLVARYHPKYIDLLKMLIDVDPDPHKISKEVYRCRNRIYEYTDKKNILKVIK